MIRAIGEDAVLFLIPFGLFAVFLLLQRRKVLQFDSWSSSAIGLATAGLVLIIATFVAAGLFSERHTGAYVPPHMENGRPVPGEFR